MISHTTVFDHIDQQRKVFVQRLIDYVAQPSISAQGVGMAETADFLLGQLQGLGMDARLLPSAGWPFVFGERQDAPGKPTVLLYGHYDVQPPDPLDEWASPPFEPEIRDGRIYGRGVGDNKGQHFAQLLAIESLLATMDKLPCNVIVLLEGEEEVGSPHIADFVQAYRDLLRADLVVTADGPMRNDTPTLSFGVRGVMSFELRAQEANQDLHSGNWGGIVPNPLWTLVHLLASMKDEQGRILIEGFYDDVLPPTELERQTLDRLPVDVDQVKRDLAIGHLDAPRDRPFYDRLALWPTLTINGLHGGYDGPKSKTVLPARAVAKCDIRLVEGMTLAETARRVEAHVTQHAPGVEFVLLNGMEPSKTPMESPFVAPIRTALEQAHGQAPVLVPAMGGSLPSYVWTKQLGLPAFGTPYANTDEGNHGPNENLKVNCFVNGIKTGAALLLNLGM